MFSAGLSAQASVS